VGVAVLRVCLAVLGVYALVLVLMFFLQEKMIFFPSKLAKSHSYSFSQPFSEHFIQTGDAAINVLAFDKDDARGVIIYFHGNAGDLDSWGDVSADFKDAPYHFLIWDYRGYGKSTGKISSEAQLRADAEHIHEFAKKRYGAGEVIIYGRSIGTGIASWLAAQHPPSLLILESPYFSLVDMVSQIYPFVPSFLVQYKLRNDRWLVGRDYPIHLFHGDKDGIVPYSNSVRLENLASNIVLHTIHNGGHNDLSVFSEYTRQLKPLLSF
jgi:uncharacterized protein